jgi:hypothetical protein
MIVSFEHLLVLGVCTFLIEIAYLEKGGYIAADGVAWASWHDSSATDFCGYFLGTSYKKGGG